MIVDEVNVWDEYRSKEVQMYKNHGARKVVAIVFQTSLEVCLERNSKRERKVSDDFIRKCYEELRNNPPRLEEGFDNIIYISI